MTSCPAGYYCTAGLTTPQACPIGYYKASTSSISGSVADCTSCPGTAYCAVTGLTAPGLCDAGYYLTAPGSFSLPEINTY